MCKDCGCSITEHHHEEHNHHHNHEIKDKKVVDVIQNILDKNDKQAMSNRKHFEEHGVLCINVMSSTRVWQNIFIRIYYRSLKR